MKGFTLVELLVVMAIIAFLTIGSFAGLTFGLRQARDTQRRNIVSQLNTALLAYYADFQKYPSTGYTCSTNVPGSSYIKCTTAFTATGGIVGGTGSAGVADYIEGKFNWGPYGTPAAGGANDGKIGYYVSSAANPTRVGICTKLENTNSGNVATAGGTIKDCYCLGSDIDTYACVSLTL